MTVLREERGDGRKIGTLTREDIREALRLYASLYGDDFPQSAFAPSQAKRNGRPDLVEIYYRGRPDGRAWISLNAIKSKYDGSWNAARADVGLPPNSTGPASGRRPPGSAEPILTVRERRVVVDPGVTAALRRQLEKAERRAARAEERLEDAKAKAATRRIVEVPVVDERKIRELRERLADERARRKDVQRELFNAERREVRARERQKVTKGIARAGDPLVLREVERLTDRLADAQVRIRELEVPAGVPVPTKTKTKVVTRTVKAPDEKLLCRVERAEAKLVELRAELARVEALRADGAERLASVRRDVMAEAAVDARVRRAERRVVEAEKRMAELAELTVGQRRSLTAAEMVALRRDGPSGEALLAAALKGLRRARLEGGKAAVAEALRELASAAMTWESKL